MKFFEIIQVHPLSAGRVNKFNTDPPPNQLELLPRISQCSKPSHCAKINRGPQNFSIETKRGPNFEGKWSLEKDIDEWKLELLHRISHYCSTFLVKACWYWAGNQKYRWKVEINSGFSKAGSQHVLTKKLAALLKIFQNLVFFLSFLSDPGVPGVRSMGPDLCHWLQDHLLT